MANKKPVVSWSMADIVDSVAENRNVELKQSFDIIKFASSPWEINFKLRPIQKLVLKCLYGIPLDDKTETIVIPDLTNEHELYKFTEVEALDFLYREKRCNIKEVIPGHQFPVFSYIGGRRAGKSTLGALIAAYELRKLLQFDDPAEHYGKVPGSNVSVQMVAPTEDQALETFANLRQHVIKCASMSERVTEDTQTSLGLRTNADMKTEQKRKSPSISVFASGCSANALRGHNNIVVILDEMSFFLSNGGRFSGDEVYNALAPSTVGFGRDGKIIMLSSPKIRYGKFYETYQASFEENETILMFKLPSSYCDQTLVGSWLAYEKRSNPSNFMCEYGGEFGNAKDPWIEKNEYLDACVAREDELKGLPNEEYFMGIDLAMKNDGTAIAIVHKNLERNKFILDLATVFYAKNSDVWNGAFPYYQKCDKYRDSETLTLHDMADEIEYYCKWYPIRKGGYDQWCEGPISEELRKRGLMQFSSEQLNSVNNYQMYNLLKTLILEERIELYRNEVLLREMMSLEATYKDGNRVTVQAPKGGHDDLTDAVAKAVWECFKYYSNQDGGIATGTKKMGGGHYGGYSQSPIHHDVSRDPRLAGMLRSRFLRQKLRATGNKSYH